MLWEERSESDRKIGRDGQSKTTVWDVRVEEIQVIRMVWAVGWPLE